MYNTKNMRTAELSASTYCLRRVVGEVYPASFLKRKFSYEQFCSGWVVNIDQEKPNLCLRAGNSVLLVHGHFSKYGGRADLYFLHPQCLTDSCEMKITTCPVGALVVGSEPSVEGLPGRALSVMNEQVREGRGIYTWALDNACLSNNQLVIAIKRGQLEITNVGQQPLSLLTDSFYVEAKLLYDFLNNRKAA